VRSDTFCKSTASNTDYIINSDSFNPDYCLSLLSGSLKKKAYNVVASIEGFHMENEQKLGACLILAHYIFVTDSIQKTDNIQNIFALSSECQLALLCTILGFGRDSAITIISEIGVDKIQFSSAKRPCCLADLTPGNNESADKRNLSEHLSLEFTSNRFLFKSLTLRSRVRYILTSVSDMSVLPKGEVRKGVLLPSPECFSQLSITCCLRVWFSILQTLSRLICHRNCSISR
jgi:hypothetical protein